ncbi:MAG: hypothetical protein ACOYJB_06005 [Christensenellaceae bacterium]|jgi:hypothetical protein
MKEHIPHHDFKNRTSLGEAFSLEEPFPYPHCRPALIRALKRGILLRARRSLLGRVIERERKRLNHIARSAYKKQYSPTSAQLLKPPYSIRSTGKWNHDQ